VLRPAIAALVSRSVSRREQGVVLGLMQSLNSVAQILAPPLAGFLIERGDLTAWAWAAAGCATLGLIGTRWGSSAFTGNAVAPAAPAA
jgi:MFS family permease